MSSIDLLSAFLAYVADDAALALIVGDQVADKHQFASGLESTDIVAGWATPSEAIVMAYDGGATPDIDAGMERARLDCTCYGRDTVKAGAVYNRLMQIARAFQRAEVMTDNGLALLYQFYPDSSARQGQDPETHIDFVQVFMRASCHQDAVG